ncbi:Hypothetical predicted protein [Pelobates cultripes]|uniref:Vacuolar protein sorting 13 homolog C n=1 Tax=Pelobates cultripes TaxID=61616 RepID=A0AAD1VXN7_PELCU|nr:Hypothetical predicted protein [Pelobates cultripes]
MLESVLADLLNRFLGDYVENLDRSQLKLGIWGGNVALENLRIRENALSELDVPFKVKAGQIDKLTLKIPWKNLYGDAVVATLEGLYLLVVPGASIKYDAEKEERHRQEEKQRELVRIEDALQKAAEKDKPKEDKKDTFLEKLATQVIKNLQVKITNIHIRYEDDITDASIPLSVGVTLGELSLQTANESWAPCILHEATKIIYKLVCLDSFSTYWNVPSAMFYHHSREHILEDMKKGIISSNRKHKDYQYIFKPVSASAKLYMNPNAEIELNTPKLDWNMEIQHVAVELTKPQYLSMIDLLESIDYMVRNAPYRKYRPDVPLLQNIKKWWLYAINGILEVQVRKKTQMWCWKSIKQHRQNLNSYKNAYKNKLTQSKPSEELIKELQVLEKDLDVFNIVLARQQAQAEVIRSGQKLLAKKSTQGGEKKSGGWFGGLWGRKEATKKEDSELSVPEKIDDLLTPEEKAKLFTAIGYSESSYNLTLPKTYVAHVLGLKLLSTSITIREDTHTPETLNVQIIGLGTKVYQRPGAKALKVEAKLEHWYVTGLCQKTVVPSLVTSIGSNKSSLLEIVFETNPENSTSDQVLILQSQPVEMIYDAITINALAEFFQTNKGMNLEQLTSATLMKLEEIKEKTAAGLNHIIETRKVLDLRINLQPSYLLLPESGFYHEKTNLIIVDFGSFQLNSINQANQQAGSVSSLEELMSKAYDKFDIKIKNIQMMFGRPGEDWKKARVESSSSLHILQPLDIEVQLEKAMVERDGRMPRFKVSGELPLLHMRISDQKLKGVFSLLDSIPFPKKTSSTPTTRLKNIPAIRILTTRPEKLFEHDIAKSLTFEEEDSESNDEYFDTDDEPSIVKTKGKEVSIKTETESSAETVQELTDLHLKFEVKEVAIELNKQFEKQEKTVLVLNIQQLGTDALIRTFDLKAVSYLKKINLDYYDIQGFSKQPLHLISSSDKQGLDLLKVEYIKADKTGPNFQTTFENTEQTLKVAFSSMDLLLHSQALLSAISFLTEAIPSLPDKAEQNTEQKTEDKKTFVKKATKVSKDKDVFAFKLFAKLGAFCVNVWDGKNHIAEIKIQGLDSSILLQQSQIEVFARLQDIIVIDVNPQSIHKKAVSIMEDEVFKFILTLYPEATQGEAYKDVSKVDGKMCLKVGCMQIVFLHKFLASLLNFLNNFQAAKEKLSVATTQAAKRAATSVKGLAERSFRLLMDIHLKAPVIIIPQSSVSNNAIVADLGLLRIHNVFSLILCDDQQLPPVVDCMTINLTKFKLSRTTMHSTPSHSDIQILYPINLNLMVNRNLAATWYHQIPGIAVKGHLDTLDVSISWISLPSSAQEDAFILKLSANLNAFNVFVCDEACNIADIRIQGMDASVDVQTKQTKMFARLQDIVVLDVDPKTIHRKAVFMMGEEVFSFNMILYSDATEGAAYTDMSAVDGKLSLKVGCMHIVYLHKFLMSLLNFMNKFQAAKEALTTATAQAAEIAALSMKDFAQKSFRLSMDVHLKAPVIIIPQSSISTNAIVADLGLIKVQNKFSLVPGVDGPLPPIIDHMDIQLTKLQLSRTVLLSGSAQPELQLLQPVNLLVSLQRNLAVSWYSHIPGLQIDGKLEPMQIAVSQDDLKILMSCLFENLAETPSLPRAALTPGIESSIESAERVKMEISESGQLKGQPSDDTQTGPAQDEESEPTTATLTFDFNFDSLSVVLYNSKAAVWLHDEKLRLGEMRLHMLTSTGKMFEDGSMEFSSCLRTCTLDDLREGITRATSRMIDQKDESSQGNMIDINYKQRELDRSVTAILDKLYVCASIEFLMTVADLFINAMPQGPAVEKSAQIQPKQATLSHAKPGKGEISEQPRFNVSALIMDPEIVFVASLTKADAPALAMSFQGKVTLSNVNNKQAIKAVVKELKVLACPFLRELRGHNITTILQPCSLQLESSTDDVGGQSASLSVGEVIIKISPIILNTVQTIAVALKPKPTVEEGTRNVIEHRNIWDVRNTDSCDNWFLGVDVAHEAEDCFQMEENAKKLQNFDIEVKSVQVTMECGLGHRTVPLLLVESTLTGTVKNWSSFVNVNADTTLEIHYYNENYAVWEPLIERVDDGNRCWSLKLEMKNNPVQDRSFLPGDDFILLPEPQSAISISSRDTMNITISKCSLSVFSNLAKAFSEGTASTFDYSLKDRAPVTVKNALGVPIILQHSGNMREFGSSKQESIHEVPKGQSFDLEFSSMESLHRGKLSALRRQESSLFTIGIVPHGYTEMGNIPITKPSRRLYNIRSPTQETCVSVLVQIDATEGNKVISIRSPLQIKNHFSVPFVVCKYVPNAKLLEAIGVCRPDEEFHVPLNSYRCQLFLKPSGSLEGQFTTSTTYIMWKEMLHRSSEVRCTLQCPAVEVNFLPLIVNCQAVPDEINFIASNGEKDWDPAYIIHLYPSLTLRNLLPYSFRYLLEGAAEAPELAEGSCCDIIHSRIDGEIMELVLVKYQGRNWNGHFRIRDTVPEFFAVCFTADTSELMTVDLHIHVKRIGNRMIMSVFSPYWIINKTSRILQYRAEDIHVKHPADYRDVILFSFKKKNIFSKNKLCISTSSWSTGFSLDTVGSYGCVKCPAGKMQYLVGVNIKMSSFNLSRIVTLTPFYTLVNKTDMELEVGEVTADGSLPDFKWYYVSSSECVPFWPENISGKMCVRVIGCEGISKPFFFNKQDNGTLLSLASMNTGLIVDISIADHSIVIKFSEYYEGAAPALIMNHTPRAKLTYMQSGTEKEQEIGPGQARLFAWEDPTGIKKLTWKYSENTGELDLLKDESGQFAHNQDVQVHWVSFLDGRQRVLLFTEDVALVTKARQAEEMEQPDQEITVSIHSLGLSLINNEEKQEISYIGITSSGIIWEMKPKLKWKPFNQKQIMQLEQAYQKYLTGEESRWTKIDSNFEVCFSKVPMEMRLPHKCSIRRNFVSGIHVEFKQSSHQRSLRAQLYWLQVDNQLPGSMFPVVFHPVAPPKSIALDSEPKPFIDVSIITRFNEFSKVMQFKYFMVLIQCMALKVDQGFLAAIIDLFTPDTDTEAERQRTQLIQKDLDSLNRELMESSMTDITTLSFFEHFHISPLKLHLSLSMGAGGGSSDKEELEIVAISSVNLLLKSIGATLTDVDDLIFKLACFEVKYQFYKRSQLMSLVTRHYSEQFLKQLYVLVLGLDVLGNPFGLIRGLSEGVEAFFYEPFQGAVQGPEEFAEGFVIGVKSLLGHTVGGAAGVVSRITGSVGKGLAAITMDKEYQQKRREEMGRQPKDFGDSLAKGGKGLLRGVVGGVTGIITKPVEGAKKEGAAGFFKGIGKGLVGVVARPTGGIIDMASSTFQGIQRVAESTEDVSPLRPPRFIHEDGIIRPYNQNEAQGFNLFENSNIQKVDGEIYRYSCFLNQNKKVNLVVTNKRIMCVKEVEILGHRTIDWDYAFEEFVYPPTVDENVLNLTVKDHSIFQKKSQTSQEILKRIPLQNQTMAKKVLSVIDEARVSWRQQTLVRKPSERFIKQYQRSFSDSFQSVNRK